MLGCIKMLHLLVLQFLHIQVVQFREILSSCCSVSQLFGYQFHAGCEQSYLSRVCPRPFRACKLREVFHLFIRQKFELDCAKHRFLKNTFGYESSCASAVRNCSHMHGLSFAEIIAAVLLEVRLLSLAPLTFLGLDHRHLFG